MNSIWQPGMIVIARVLNPFENACTTGKARPALVISTDEGHADIVGFTTRRHYANGAPRISIPNPTALGLHKPGFLWKPGTTRISTWDIDDQIGWISPALWDVIDHNITNLSPYERGLLRTAAAQHGDDLWPAA